MVFPMKWCLILITILVQLNLLCSFSCGLMRVSGFQHHRLIQTALRDNQAKHPEHSKSVKHVPFALNKGFLSDLIDLILNALPAILAPLKEVDYANVVKVRQTEKGQTLKDYKKSHKHNEVTWTSEEAAHQFLSQYLVNIVTEEEKKRKSSEILLQILSDIENLKLLDQLNNEIQYQFKKKDIQSKLKNSDITISFDEKTESIDLKQLKEELLAEVKKREQSN